MTNFRGKKSAYANSIGIVDLGRIGKKTLVLGFLILLLVTTTTNLESMLLVIVYAIICMLVNRLFFGKAERDFAMLLFIIYSLMCIANYWLQLQLLPGSLGFAWAPGRSLIGGDDYFFFMQSTGLGFQNTSIHPFSQLLRIPLLLVVSRQPHPIDLLLFNVLPLTIIPIASAKVSFHITKDMSIARITGILSAICPFTLNYSIVLLRDGWIAACMILFMLMVLEQRYFLSIVPAFLVLFLRLSLAPLIIVVLFMCSMIKRYGTDKTFSKNNLKIILFAVLLVFLLMMQSTSIFDAFAREIQRIGLQGFYRVNLIESMEERAQTAGVFLRIQRFPGPIRFFVNLLIFLFMPIIDVRNLFQDGFIFPTLYLVFTYSIMQIAYISYFLIGVLSAFARRDKTVIWIIVGYLLFMIMISNLSLQVRHKLSFQSIYYTICAYGFVRGTSLSKKFAFFATYSYITLIVLYNLGFVL